MSDMSLFELGSFGSVRFGSTEDGELYAVASDFAKVMGYTRTSDAIKLLDDGESDTAICRIRSKSGVEQNRSMSIIFEDGLWELVFRSTLPGAKAIKGRVKEILKEIRSDGFYIKEDLSRAQSARLAERIAYTGVRDYIAGATDYVSSSATARSAFAQVQNMYHKRVTGMTAAQLVASRSNSKKVVAKDVLDERELRLEEALTYAVRASLVATFIDCEYTMKRVVDVATEAITNFKI